MYGLCGGNDKVVGEMTFEQEASWRWLDLTKALKNISAENITILLVRELREPGDDLAKGRYALIHSH